jgi:ribose 1,5-bisphosphokinase PhnN
MTQSVYVIGGAGSGKSTFTRHLLDRTGAATGPCEVFHRRRKTDGVMDPISGHWLYPYDDTCPTGLYIGRLRESFPGTDGLSRSCTPVGVEWLETAELPDYILAEGATLATEGFLSALAARTELMVVHLMADPDEVRRRMLKRGSNQKESFIKSTVTRSANTSDRMFRSGAVVLDIDSGQIDAWNWAAEEAISWMGFTSP